MDGQSGRVPDAQHQSAHFADAAGQRHTCLLANQPQDVLSSRGRETYRGLCGGQTEGGTIQGTDNINNKQSITTIPTKSKVTCVLSNYLRYELGGHRDVLSDTFLDNPLILQHKLHMICLLRIIYNWRDIYM